MTADTAVLLIPAVVAACCWLFSLRRTPWAVPLLCWQAFLGLAGVGIGVAVEQPAAHTTLAGAFAVVLVPTAASLLTTGLTEGWNVRELRNYRGKSKKRLGGPRWQVETQAHKEGKAEVVVWVLDRTDRARYRNIGEADPIADQAIYLALVAEARNVADELNALKVGE
ncbi:MAG: hypothetical protein ACYCQK_01975 [Acidiferrobacteraceae bacterium]